jgi:hypothetical protein
MPATRFRFKMLPAAAACSILVSFQSLSADNIADTKPVPLKQGDRCFVCGVELVDGGIAFIYRGKRVTVDALHVETFFQHPLKYISKLKPKGALFQEDAILETAMGSGWLWSSIWLAAGLISAALCTHIALRKGLPPARWFAIGLATHLVGLLLALRRRPDSEVSLPPNLAKIPNTANPARCPACNAANHPSAKQCPACGAALNPALSSEVERSGLDP